MLTPTGYRCKECVRGQQKVFETARSRLPCAGGSSSAAVVAFLGSFVAPVLRFFTIFLAPIAGADHRRSRALGGQPPALALLFHRRRRRRPRWAACPCWLIQPGGSSGLPAAWAWAALMSLVWQVALYLPGHHHRLLPVERHPVLAPGKRYPMLTELRIENFAIIQQPGAEFEPGLVTFTGETGAGKSIILDAIMALVGGKADAT